MRHSECRDWCIRKNAGKWGLSASVTWPQLWVITLMALTLGQMITKLQLAQTCGWRGRRWTQVECGLTKPLLVASAACSWIGYNYIAHHLSICPSIHLSETQSGTGDTVKTIGLIYFGEVFNARSFWVDNAYLSNFLFHLSCLLKQTKTRLWLIVSYYIAIWLPLCSKCWCCVVKCNLLLWACYKSIYLFLNLL